MAKAIKAGKTGIKAKKEKLILKFDSKYGSHSNMVVDVEADEAAKAFLGERVLAEGEVVCKDEDYYVTTQDRLDTGLADPNRMYRD